ncbi:hypothetical protein [Liquorilactobacillus hordei]|uniref:hypothetical protein n=1 Tax=Liquorilactobacillus hordei TaxID=468911 RepID=UPI0039ED15A9
MNKNKEFLDTLRGTSFINHYDLVENGRRNLIAKVDKVCQKNDFDDFNNEHSQYYIRVKNIFDVARSKKIWEYATFKVNRRTFDRGFKEGDLVKFNSKVYVFKRKENDDRSESFGKWSNEIVAIKEMKYMRLIKPIEFKNIIVKNKNCKSKI